MNRFLATADLSLEDHLKRQSYNPSHLGSGSYSRIKQLYIWVLSEQFLRLHGERTEGVTEASGRKTLLIDLREDFVRMDTWGGAAGGGDHEDEKFLVRAFLSSAWFEIVLIQHHGGGCS